MKDSRTITTTITKEEWDTIWDIMKELGLLHKSKSQYVRELIRADIKRFHEEYLLLSVIETVAVEKQPRGWDERFKRLVDELDGKTQTRLRAKYKKYEDSCRTFR